METFLAQDIMNENIFVVPGDWSASQLADFLFQENLPGAPVGNEQGKLIGVVSISELQRFIYDDSIDSTVQLHAISGYYTNIQSTTPHFFKNFRQKNAAFRHVEVNEIMSSRILEVKMNNTTVEIAEKMLKEKVHRLLVVEREKVVGVVTTFDLLKQCIDA